MYDVAIVGCGIVGAAAAWELSQYRLAVAILERENDVAVGTTKANSAIIHAGYDPKPHTKMAVLNIEGVHLAKELCQRLDVPYRQCGSLVVAFSPDEIPILQELCERGKINGVQDLQLLDRQQLHQVEPNLSESAEGALYAPTAAIVSPWEYALALAETAVQNGVNLFLNSEVISIRKEEEGFCLTIPGGEIRARTILNAAGVCADIVHNLIASPAYRIQPSRGEYYLLDKAEGSRAQHVIFQCPVPEGKGVLVSPTVHGNLIVGPNSQNVNIAQGTATTRSGLEFVMKQAQKSLPSIEFGQSIRNFAGIRANTEIDDFIIEEAADTPGFFDLAGIKSPGLTAAPAIAKLVVRMLREKGLVMEEKEHIVNTRKRIRFKECGQSQKEALARSNPAYGRMICRCESITEGEILDTLHTPIPPVSLDGVKRRCGAGMGRCQGGFCGPRVLEIIARENKCSPCQVLQEKAGTYILTGSTKGSIN